MAHRPPSTSDESGSIVKPVIHSVIPLAVMFGTATAWLPEEVSSLPWIPGEVQEAPRISITLHDLRSEITTTRN